MRSSAAFANQVTLPPAVTSPNAMRRFYHYPLLPFVYSCKHMAIDKPAIARLVQNALCRDKNVLSFVDTLCKATSGIGMDEVVASYMVRTFNSLYQEDCVLEYPRGGGQAIVDAMVRGLR